MRSISDLISHITIPMDRRVKFILLILVSLAMFALVGWFIVWPTIRPLIQRTFPPAQPPALPTSGTPQAFNPTTPSGEGGTPTVSGGGVITFDPGATGPDAGIITELSRRAGVLAERVESGSSQEGFANLDDAQLDASPSLKAQFEALQSTLRKQHPFAGAIYVTSARRLKEIPSASSISGSTFNVDVQLQVQVRSGDATTTDYRLATVTFTQSGQDWLTSGYSVKPFTP